ncbi:hypothetical protein Fuma_01165 [Fuerstiella marisgermanici]|uniref:DUF1656 domain-containing protein n=2 Tax=Fuerstiella marisgermanici TaxID=1891926 RepID=A0A1P8WC10_9PLAN|nr:hypothetical protein Fuma_01165 [Fuerstiella marisgermanici]
MIPHETSFEWVYFPPFFFTVLLGFVATLVTTEILNRTGLSKHFWHPGLCFLAIWILMTSVVGLCVVPP